MPIEPSRLPPTWEGLLELARHLRSPEGCPWDRAQDLRSLLPFLIEESYEVLGASGEPGRARLAEEVGDLFFVLSLVVVVAESEGSLPPFETVASRAIEKIARRHPHVFGGSTAGTPLEVERQWEEIKRAERRGGANADDGAGTLPPLDPVVPALRQAEKIQRRAASGGFDWDGPAAVVAKVREELMEVEAAGTDAASREEEIGDLLFSVTNLARHLAVDAELALRRAIEKFRRRHAAVVARLAAEGLTTDAVDASTLDRHWEAAKRAERG